MSLLCRRSRACNPLALGVLTLWHRLNIILCYSAVSVALWLQSTLLARWSWLKLISESLSSVSCTADEWYTVPEIQSSGWQIWIKMGAGGREVRFGPLAFTSAVQTLWAPSISRYSGGFIRLPVKRTLSGSCEPVLPLYNGSVWKGFGGSSNWRPTDSYYLTACH